MARRKGTLARYWGYLLLVLLYLGWFHFGLKPGVLAAMSGLVVLYSLFLAPVPCCALNRDGTTLCRNNATGLLRGCRLKQHKWQNVKLLVRRQSWARFATGVFRSVSGNLAALAAVGGFASGVAAVAALFIPK